MSLNLPDYDRLETYDYMLPPELIAQQPPERRDQSRLLVVDRLRNSLEDRTVADLPGLLQAGDLLVLNDSRVVPARLCGFRTRTGGRWEGLFLRVCPNLSWEIIGQTRGRLEAGETISVPGPQPNDVLQLRLLSQGTGGAWQVQPEASGSPWELLDHYGQIPLPPYMHRELATAADAERYQTVYANQPGSVAAPTAGLHFTPELLQRCAERGIGTAKVTLHVGLGTFRPVATDNLAEHPMHEEWCELGAVTVQAIQRTHAAGGRVIAVGTTSCRTLESAAAVATAMESVAVAVGRESDAAATPSLQPYTGNTKLFIRPPYQFQVIDGLLTNFHLPKSTLLMLVSALGGYELMQQAYAAAIERRYRFFSYGDAMLIL